MDNFKNFITRPAGIVLLIFISLTLIYLIMLWDTNPIVDYAEAVFKGEIPREEIENTPWDEYDTTNYSDGKPRGAAEVEIEISRVFVMHNFFDGYMWVTYENVGYDERGEMLYLDTAKLYPAKWKIHRENGKWVLVDVDEHP